MRFNPVAVAFFHVIRVSPLALLAPRFEMLRSPAKVTVGVLPSAYLKLPLTSAEPEENCAPAMGFTQPLNGANATDVTVVFKAV